MMDQDQRDYCTDRYERYREMFAGDPEVSDADIRAAASRATKAGNRFMSSADTSGSYAYQPMLPWKD